MGSKLEISWSNESARRTDQIIKYLSENWSTNEAENFLFALAAFEEIVTRFPEIYPIHEY